MKKTLLLLLAFVLSNVPVWAGATDLAGSYNAKGWNPGVKQSADTSYSGTVTLAKNGDVLFYEGEMDGKKYVGVGIHHPGTNTLALHFTEIETGKVGVAHFQHKAGTLEGMWAWLKHEKGKIGKEIWTPK